MSQLLTKKNKIMYQKNSVSYCVNSKGIKIPPYKSNTTEKKNTIFSGNKSFTDVLFEGLLFAFGSCVFLTIIAGCIIAVINLIN